MSRTRAMFGAIGAIGAVGIVTGALLVTSWSTAPAASGSQAAPLAATVHHQGVVAHLRTHDANSVPAGLEPPAGHVLTARFTARGVQVYQCAAGAWVFLEPAANLVGQGGTTSRIQTAIHYKGPTWESTTDGSLVQGTTIASSPVPGSIPQLLLRATENRGTGIFGRVTFINRLETRGGAAPTGSCSNGQTTGVPYTAQYLFYAPSAPDWM